MPAEDADHDGSLVFNLTATAQARWTCTYSLVTGFWQEHQLRMYTPMACWSGMDAPEQTITVLQS